MVVPPRDAMALASAIEVMAADGQEAWKRRGRAARDRIEKNWSIETTARLYQDLWRDVLDRQ